MSGFGTDSFGFAPFGLGAASTPPPRGRVYATLTASAGRATLEPSRAGTATLAASPTGLAKLSPAAGFSTLQTD